MKPRPIFQQPDGTFLVPLTHSKVAIIDACDAERVGKHSWRWAKPRPLRPCQYAAASIRGEGYTDRRTKYTLLHRFILALLPHERADHVDGNGLNNRRNNLRSCTVQQNSWNRKPKGNRKYKGVKYLEQSRKWRATIITPNKKILCCGVFESEIDAARAYDEAAIKYFGAFARLNLSHPIYVGGAGV